MITYTTKIVTEYETIKEYGPYNTLSKAITRARTVLHRERDHNLAAIIVPNNVEIMVEEATSYLTECILHDFTGEEKKLLAYRIINLMSKEVESL